MITPTSMTSPALAARTRAAGLSVGAGTASVLLGIWLARAASPDIALGALLGVAVCAIVFFRPIAVYVVWLVAVPLAGDFTPLTAVGSLNVSRLAIILSAAAILGQAASPTRAVRLGLVLPAAAFISASVISYSGRPTAFTGDRTALINNVIAPMVACITFGVINLTRRDAARIASAIGVVATALAIVSIVDHERHGGGFFTANSIYRPAGPFEHALILATVIALCAVPTLERLTSSRGRTRSLPALAISVSVAGIFYTYSRGPLIAFAAALLYLLFRGLRLLRLRVEFLVALALAGLAVRSALHDTVVLARLSSADTFDTRLSLYRSAWSFFKANWLLGLGVRGFGHAIGSQLPTALSSATAWFAVDNYYLNVLVEGGIVAALAFGVLVFVASRRVAGSAADDHLHRAGAAMVIIGFVVCLDFNALSYPSIAALTFFGLRLLYLPRLDDREFAG